MQNKQDTVAAMSCLTLLAYFIYASCILIQIVEVYALKHLDVF